MIERTLPINMIDSPDHGLYSLRDFCERLKNLSVSNPTINVTDIIRDLKFLFVENLGSAIDIIPNMIKGLAATPNYPKPYLFANLPESMQNELIVAAERRTGAFASAIRVTLEKYSLNNPFTTRLLDKLFYTTITSINDEIFHYISALMLKNLQKNSADIMA